MNNNINSAQGTHTVGILYLHDQFGHPTLVWALWHILLVVRQLICRLTNVWPNFQLSL